MNQRRGFTQNPVVQVIAAVLIILWWGWTYTQEPVYGRLLRLAGVSGAITLVGAIALAFGTAVQAWWIILWAIAVIVFIVAMYNVSARSAYNEAWLRDQAFAARVDDFLDAEDDFAEDEQAARVAAREMRERFIRGQSR